MNRILASKWTKVVLFVLCLTPFLKLAWGAFLIWRGNLDLLPANPIEYVTHYTGDWILRFLLITLSITPLRLFFKRPQLTRFRRMLGLFAFFYAILHFSTWFAVDKAFSLTEMWADVLKRPYITVGMSALLGMAPLALTSTAGWVRRMGYKRWQKLHKLIYFCGLAGVIHYYWLVKSDVRLPLMYAAIWAGLMTVRVVTWMKSRRPRVLRPANLKST